MELRDKRMAQAMDDAGFTEDMKEAVFRTNNFCMATIHVALAGLPPTRRKAMVWAIRATLERSLPLL